MDSAAPAGGATKAATTARSRLLLAGWGAAAVGEMAAQPLRALRDSGDTDFVYAFMTAARMLHDGTPGIYVRSAARAARESFVHGLVPTAVNDLYTNPPLAAWLIQPIALLPPDVALVTFLATSLLAIVASGWILATRVLGARTGRPGRGLVTLLCLATVPGAQALAIANWDCLLLLALAGATWAAVSRRPLLCGVLLSVMLVKPQTVWLVPLGLLLTGQRRTLGGFLIGAAVWLATTPMLVGFGGMRDWYDNNLPAHLAEAHQTIGIPGVVADAAGGGGAFVTALVLVPMAAALVWRIRHVLAADAVLTVGVLVAGSALCAPHIWPEDLLLTAVPLVVLARARRGLALACAAGLNIAYLLDNLAPVPLHAEGIALAALLAALLRGALRASEAPGARAPVAAPA